MSERNPDSGPQIYMHVCQSAKVPCTIGAYHYSNGRGGSLCGEPIQGKPLDKAKLQPHLNWPCFECSELRFGRARARG